MSCASGTAGLAALSVCESILLSLTENGVIDADEARGILEDAAAAHRGAAPAADGAAGDHREAAAGHRAHPRRRQLGAPRPGRGRRTGRRDAAPPGRRRGGR
jgi:hypothetical protein